MNPRRDGITQAGGCEDKDTCYSSADGQPPDPQGVVPDDDDVQQPHADERSGNRRSRTVSAA